MVERASELRAGVADQMMSYQQMSKTGAETQAGRNEALRATVVVIDGWTLAAPHRFSPLLLPVRP